MGAATTETFATARMERKTVMVHRKYVDLLMIRLVSMMGRSEVKDYALWLGTQKSLGSRVGHRTLIVLSLNRIEMVNSKSFYGRKENVT